MTKLFFDCEFSGLHQFTNLISLGIVAESGETFYAEFTDYDPLQIDDWIKENVIAKLRLTDKIINGGIWENWINDGVSAVNRPNMKEYECVGETWLIKSRLELWLSQFEKIQMWSDCLSYDWVLFCNIFGHAFDIPKNIFYIPFDISTMFEVCGFDPDTNRESFAGLDANGLKHNALWDAKVIKACYEKLNKIQGTMVEGVHKEVLEMGAQLNQERNMYNDLLESRDLEIQRLKEPYMGWCDVEGCENEGCSGGLAWRDSGYWTVCYKHSADFREGKPQPKMKQSAIDREASRDKDGYLPFLPSPFYDKEK